MNPLNRFAANRQKGSKVASLLCGARHTKRAADASHRPLFTLGWSHYWVSIKKECQKEKEQARVLPVGVTLQFLSRGYEEKKQSEL